MLPVVLLTHPLTKEINLIQQPCASLKNSKKKNDHGKFKQLIHKIS